MLLTGKVFVVFCLNNVERHMKCLEGCDGETTWERLGVSGYTRPVWASTSGATHSISP